ncbi:hypothetical protein D3C85_48930 [compost metagenome]|jgi:hypothetical protein
MKRLALLGLLAGTSMLVFLGVNQISRAAEPLMSEAHIERIRSNCTDAHATLTQLHASDALLRVNRGQIYESISTKLMATFNSRVSLNRLDATQLVMSSSIYERELAAFRTDYQLYEQQMSDILKIDCSKQPVAFYDAIGQAREKRMKVREHIVALSKQINDYKIAFDALEKQYLSSLQEEK